MGRSTKFALGTLLAGLALASAAIPGAADRRQPHSGGPSLKAFHSCPSLLRYAKKHPKAVEAIRPVKGRDRFLPLSGRDAESVGGDDSGDSGPPSSSTTNVQEEGVDEPDIVKAQGALLFVMSDGKLQVIDAGSEAPAKLDSLKLPGGQGSSGEGQLLVHGNRALAIVDGSAGLVLHEIEIGDPTELRILRTMTVDGSYVDARMHGGVARVVLETVPQLPPLPAREAGDRRAGPGKLRVRRPGKLMPRATVKDRSGGRKRRFPLVDCGQVRHPRPFAGLEMLTVLTIDLSQGLPPVDSDAIMTDGDIVYASQRSLYVATSPWSQIDSKSTEIHRFALDAPATEYAASGKVPGTMLSQWSMSEHEGALRVASTKEPSGRGRRRRPSESLVTALSDDGAGSLVAVGQVGGIGRGERIEAVRFIGDTGFVVTFRQIDPLFTLDLSEPTAPRVVGEMKIRGYSAYLHPVGEDRLLGVGQDATPDGALKGTQLSLFDTSNLADPVRIDQVQVGGDSSSEVEFDHQAFLHWAPKSLAMIPVSILSRRSGRELFAGSVGVRVASGSVDELVRITHGAPPGSVIRRAAVAGGRLATVSPEGVLVSDLDSFGPIGWVPLRHPHKKKGARRKKGGNAGAGGG